jgi:hypothetical protein
MFYVIALGGIDMLPEAAVFYSDLQRTHSTITSTFMHFSLRLPQAFTNFVPCVNFGMFLTR